MKVGGELSANRERWLEGAYDYWKEKYYDEANFKQVQRKRMATLQSISEAQTHDGVETISEVGPWEILQTRVKLGRGSPPGVDNQPAEVIQALPTVCALAVGGEYRQSLSQRCGGGPFIANCSIPRHQERSNSFMLGQLQVDMETMLLLQMEATDGLLCGSNNATFNACPKRWIHGEVYSRSMHVAEAAGSASLALYVLTRLERTRLIIDGLVDSERAVSVRTLVTGASSSSTGDRVSRCPMIWSSSSDRLVASEDACLA